MNEVKRPIYRHYKGGLYEFIGEATIEAHEGAGREERKFVVYRSVDDLRMWVMPIAEFYGKIPNGKRVFEYVSSDGG